MLVNTQYFNEEARYFKKHGKYDCGPRGSKDYINWWNEQHKRCLYGYSTGGMHITGYHYNYLNFTPIQVVERTGTGKAGKRRLDFPKFWDLDYAFFHSADIAKYGCSVEYLDSLAISIPIARDNENLSGGKHLGWLKGRGVGASFKGGSMASRNYHHINKSKTFLLADQKEYLTKDGIYSKFLEYMDWININASEFREYHEVKGDRNNMHFINSYYNDDKTVDGLNAEVLGVTIQNDPDKVRGKRGILYLWEESGRFGNLDAAWNIARSSVEEDGVVYGLMIFFGTGGTEGADFDSMKKMFYNPRAFNVLAFNNIWDMGMQGTDCALFTPAIQQIQHIDLDGNSDLEAGQRNVEELWKQAEQSSDPTDLVRVRAEKPMSPQDAMLNTSINKFASEGIIFHRNYMLANANYKNYGNAVELYRHPETGKIVTRLNIKHPPIIQFPHNSKMDLFGSVVEWSKPYVDPITGQIPDNLYIICHDPYADNHAADKTSLGAAYVIMNPNNVVPHDRGDRIVAEWVGRPDTTDEYNEVLFMLAERWNAKIGFENDRGDVQGFAKRKKSLHLLAPEFELGWDDNIATKKLSGQKFGMRIGSGKLNTKLHQGNTYISEWLNTIRTEDLEGKIVNNFNLIHTIGLLDELISYRDDGNFDRVSALRIGMYYMRELVYKDRVPSTRGNSKKSFKKFLQADRFQ